MPGMPRAAVRLTGAAAVPAVAVPAAAAAAETLNLARRPFVNTRPVERLAAILWVLGVLLLVANVTLFMGYLNSSQETRVKLAGRGRDIETE
ncbi:MAG: hypothetical protein JOZ15_08990, partial [Acidobacteria bacterium]|nr:hypothetical protein [Acidobacteriota bacterium]